MPILGAVALDDSLVVLDNNNQLWHCSTTNENPQWVQNIPQPSFTIASFLAAGDSYIAAYDKNDNVYLIQTPNGEWLPAQNLIPLD
ncbi:hypothetical protein BN2497_743 [Janthinobacterium sp. CG23_2]|nr:hypothetical protein BN2497_743 [Janthinobacterium sp. CG23_2]CUU26769.1 hypothetical protein BN3177_743 [Janthinobacterium sp. CG23_2]